MSAAIATVHDLLPASEDETIGSVLGRLQEEIQDLAGRSDGIQAVLSGIIAKAALGRDDLVGLQDLDFVVQHLGNLATFMRDLRGQLPEDWRVRPDLAAGSLELASLAGRLAGRDTTEVPGAATADEDDALFF